MAPVLTQFCRAAIVRKGAPGQVLPRPLPSGTRTLELGGTQKAWVRSLPKASC